MIRYRCPHCAVLVVAHERRAGQSSVCKACVKPHPIPADQSLWLNELGAPLHPPAPAPPAPEPIPVLAPVVSVEPPIPPPPSAPEPVPPPVAASDLRAESVPELLVPERAEPVRVDPPAPLPVPVAVTVRDPEPVAPAAPAPAPEPEPVPPALAALNFSAVSMPNLELPELPPSELAPPVPVVVAVRDPEPPAAPNPGPAPLQSRFALVASVDREDDFPPQPDSGGVVTVTPPPAPAYEPPGRSRPAPVSVTPAPRLPGRLAPVPVPTRSDSGSAEPVQLQTQADIAVALTAALTSRMKPPATPRRDLRPSTAAWMSLTAIGAVCAALALFTDPAYRWLAVLVGATQVVIGYVWIVRLAWGRDPVRGLWSLFPPVAAYYLGQYKYAKFRPLRFVTTGVALVVLAAWAAVLNPHVRALVGRTEPPAVQSDSAAQSKLGQLRALREQRSYDALSKLLDLLAKTDPLLSEDAKDRAELSAELKKLCEHPDTGVKVRAMAAYARWDPNGARAVCLAAVRSPTADEREWALRLLPQWKDAESARAVQSLIGRPGTVETNRAKAALEEIGGVAAEQATIALLNRAEDQGTKLTALSVLEKVGGVETASWLRSSYAAAADDPVVRDRALTASDAITARVRVPVPAPSP